MCSWTTLLETAIYAPSPHNIQPWRVRIHDRFTADLYFDRQRLLPDEDITGNFLIATAGIFIEAIAILAGNRQDQLDYQLHPSAFAAIQRPRSDDRSLILVARLTLSPNPNIQPQYPDELFLKRRTSRLAYTAPVSELATKALTKLAQSWNYHYQQVNSDRPIAQILDRNIDAVIEDFNQHRYRAEILTWLRFSRAQALKTRDGLDYRCMNSPPIDFWAMAHFPGLAKLPGLSQFMRQRYRQQLGKIPTLGILAGEFWQPTQAFVAGRFLLQFWLEATRHGLYLQPFGNLVTNERAAQWCASQFDRSNIWLIFKIGPSAEPPQSYRRHVQDILITEPIIT
jgi:hypothetical protein